MKDISGHKMLIKEHALYPALHKLLDDGFLEVEKVYIGKRVRTYYKLTRQGEVQKEAQFAELHEFLKTIQYIVFPQFNTVNA
ncbi:DNA-binding PadR family transcriptional regulator [Catalinimonas alkaloidigena]|uniref:PadR family transcriptional regulator n=1 Tax=Catalinimonas alkaloidigena TaxID=1075417 RepID=UPI002406AF10|nr:helix-turn-helix transcriptional regulator [Catalinimonas alkaloidigena]MDF9798568.1 DNA-binding PadR family transcriptional regulator [Catalinimonas alkaloidigena]